MKRLRCRVIDTYNDFLAYWKISKSKSIDEQVTLWKDSYMKKYPELLRKQTENYEEANVNWQETARNVMQCIPLRLNLMEKARDNILQVCRPIYARATEKLGVDFETTFVIYVGIGCGAGWATTFNKRPSILLGLENIAEEKWQRRNKLEGLMSHEIGHLAHMKWRKEWGTFEKAAEDPLFRLYIEGFAQRCEHIILEKETWHMASGKHWLSWCQQHKDWLAKEFLKRLAWQNSLNDFFGSWFSIRGKKQTGYFLGHAVICDLESTYGLRDVALLGPKELKRLIIECLNSFRNETTC